MGLPGFIDTVFYFSGGGSRFDRALEVSVVGHQRNPARVSDARGLRRQRGERDHGADAHQPSPGSQNEDLTLCRRAVAACLLAALHAGAVACGSTPDVYPIYGDGGAYLFAMNLYADGGAGSPPRQPRGRWEPELLLHPFLPSLLDTAMGERRGVRLTRSQTGLSVHGQSARRASGSLIPLW